MKLKCPFPRTLTTVRELGLMIIALLFCLLSLHGSDDFETKKKIIITPNVRNMIVFTQTSICRGVIMVFLAKTNRSEAHGYALCSKYSSSNGVYS